MSSNPSPDLAAKIEIGRLCSSPDHEQGTGCLQFKLAKPGTLPKGGESKRSADKFRSLQIRFHGPLAFKFILPIVFYPILNDMLGFCSRIYTY